MDTEKKYPLPPFTFETAKEKVPLAQNKRTNDTSAQTGISGQLGVQLFVMLIGSKSGLFEYNNHFRHHSP